MACVLEWLGLALRRAPNGAQLRRGHGPRHRPLVPLLNLIISLRARDPRADEAERFDWAKRHSSADMSGRSRRLSSTAGSSR